VTDKCGCCIGIERKRLGDFLQSLRTGRLESQMHRVMGDLFPCLLLEGVARTIPSATGGHRVLITGGSGNWSLGSLQMKIWSLQERGTRVIWTAGQEETVDTLRCLQTRADQGCVIGRGSSAAHG
jgi:ERCC4-type nuclease